MRSNNKSKARSKSRGSNSFSEYKSAELNKGKRQKDEPYINKDDEKGFQNLQLAAGGWVGDGIKKDIEEAKKKPKIPDELEKTGLLHDKLRKRLAVEKNETVHGVSIEIKEHIEKNTPTMKAKKKMFCCLPGKKDNAKNKLVYDEVLKSLTRIDVVAQENPNNPLSSLLNQYQNTIKKEVKTGIPEKKCLKLLELSYRLIFLTEETEHANNKIPEGFNILRIKELAHDVFSPEETRKKTQLMWSSRMQQLNIPKIIDDILEASVNKPTLSP